MMVVSFYFDPEKALFLEIRRGLAVTKHCSSYLPSDPLAGFGTNH
jgi:hypothetical protein